MVLKRVERDPAYAALLREMLDDVARGAGFADCDEAGFYDLQGFIFVTSPRAETPFHYDPEENKFVQIRGRKAFHQYDNRDQLWRVSEGHVINYYELPVLWTTLEVHTDLQAGRYLAIGLDNENKMYDFNISRTPEDYTPAALRREGMR